MIDFDPSSRAQEEQMGGVAWTKEEDELLKKYIQHYGEGKWHRIPHLAGLRRCRKSCRLRWVNYLRPNIKRGSFSEEEDEIIVKLQKLLGNRWSLIAGKLPGRTANDVKNYWNCHLIKRIDGGEAAARNIASSVTREPQEVESSLVYEGATENEQTVLNACMDKETNNNVQLEQVKAISNSIWEWDDLVFEDIDFYNASFSSLPS